eukprot:TRINITY_DN19046_c0_g1_i2.p1 TRINITY_DN19046_c0_g1~~TRINITY_DN19046_c0_g1_i2.p1  ORF type:complete len:1148 (+),score=429.95 TRINITY_DN19046_c0_g1_i2:219-3446(+)
MRVLAVGRSPVGGGSSAELAEALAAAPPTLTLWIAPEDVGGLLRGDAERASTAPGVESRACSPVRARGGPSPPPSQRRRGASPTAARTGSPPEPAPFGRSTSPVRAPQHPAVDPGGPIHQFPQVSPARSGAPPAVSTATLVQELNEVREELIHQRAAAGAQAAEDRRRIAELERAVRALQCRPSSGTAAEVGKLREQQRAEVGQLREEQRAAQAEAAAAVEGLAAQVAELSAAQGELRGVLEQLLVGAEEAAARAARREIAEWDRKQEDEAPEPAAQPAAPPPSVPPPKTPAAASEVRELRQRADELRGELAEMRSRQAELERKRQRDLTAHLEAEFRDLRQLQDDIRMALLGRDRTEILDMQKTFTDTTYHDISDTFPRENSQLAFPRLASPDPIALTATQLADPAEEAGRDALAATVAVTGQDDTLTATGLRPELTMTVSSTIVPKQHQELQQSSSFFLQPLQHRTQPQLQQTTSSTSQGRQQGPRVQLSAHEESAHQAQQGPQRAPLQQQEQQTAQRQEQQTAQRQEQPSAQRQEQPSAQRQQSTKQRTRKASLHVQSSQLAKASSFVEGGSPRSMSGASDASSRSPRARQREKERRRWQKRDAALRQSLNTLGEAKGLSGRVSALEEQLRELVEGLEDLRGAGESAADELAQRVDGLDDQLGGLDSRLGQMGRVQVLEEQMARLTAALDDQQRVGESAQDELRQRLSGLAPFSTLTRVDEMEQQIRKLTAELQSTAEEERRRGGAAQAAQQGTVAQMRAELERCGEQLAALEAAAAEQRERSEKQLAALEAAAAEQRRRSEKQLAALEAAAAEQRTRSEGQLAALEAAAAEQRTRSEGQLAAVAAAAAEQRTRSEGRVAGLEAAAAEQRARCEGQLGALEAAAAEQRARSEAAEAAWRELSASQAAGAAALRGELQQLAGRTDSEVTGTRTELMRRIAAAEDHQRRAEAENKLRAAEVLKHVAAAAQKAETTMANADRLHAASEAHRAGQQARTDQLQTQISAALDGLAACRSAMGRACERTDHIEARVERIERSRRKRTANPAEDPAHHLHTERSMSPPRRAHAAPVRRL